MNTRQNLKKKDLSFRSEIGISDIFFKRLYKESFEDLQINRNWKFQIRATVSHGDPWWPFNVFAKLHKSPFLIANIIKDVLSDLRQFLATESPWKLMKNAFYFILEALFVLKIFKFSSWGFGQVKKWLD